MELQIETGMGKRKRVAQGEVMEMMWEGRTERNSLGARKKGEGQGG